MIKPPRSPVRGYNHNVKYRGRVFHVQTEDSGPAKSRLFTHLYFGGTILASKRHEYDGNSAPEIVRSLMQSQHKSILKDLKSGKHDAQLLQFFAARGEKLEDATPGQLDAGDHDLPEELLAGPSERTPPPLVMAAAAAGPGAAVPFTDSFEDEPTNPDEGRALAAFPVREPVVSGLPALPVAPTPRRSGTPALGTVVRRERIIALGGSTPTPTPVGLRPRRPAPSIPYVVQEGSHPVAAAAPAATAAGPEAPAPRPPAAVVEVGPSFVPPPRTAPAAASPAPARSSPPPAPVPVSPPSPLGPTPLAPESAPLTAAVTGASPEIKPATGESQREDSQSLDEVIMAYLSRGVGDVGNVG